MGLEFVEMAMEVEEEFGISFSDAKLEKIRTIKEYANEISKIYQENKAPKEKYLIYKNHQDIVEKIKALTSKHFNVSIDTLKENTSFITLEGW